MSKLNKVQSHWKQIKCPYFHSDDATSINCEGIRENSTIRQIFHTKEQKKAYEHQFCNDINKCKDCLIYYIANQKY